MDRWRVLAAAALLVALVSLAVTGFLLWRISHPEPLIRAALERAGGDARIEDGVLHYTVRVPAGTPLSLDIPVDERFMISVDTMIPIRTTVRLPLPAPFDNRVVPVPVRANVPLRARVPVAVRDTFRLRTRTQREISVPLRIRF